MFCWDGWGYRVWSHRGPVESVSGLWQVHVNQGFKSQKGLRLCQKWHLITTVPVPHQMNIHSRTHKRNLNGLFSLCIVTINSLWISITLENLSIHGRECECFHSSGSQYWWRASFFHFLHTGMLSFRNLPVSKIYSSLKKLHGKVVELQSS